MQFKQINRKKRITGKNIYKNRNSFDMQLIFSFDKRMFFDSDVRILEYLNTSIVIKCFPISGSKITKKKTEKKEERNDVVTQLPFATIYLNILQENLVAGQKDNVLQDVFTLTNPQTPLPLSPSPLLQSPISIPGIIQSDGC